MIGAKTKLSLVIGDPVGHSKSPELHNLLYQQQGLEGSFAFLAWRVPAEELAAALRLFRYAGVSGISVTIPHKEAIIQYLDQLDPLAQRVGAVNTVVNQKGRLLGYNTDINGILAPLRRRIDLVGARVLVLGAGGAARACVFALVEAGAFVKILNRSHDRAQRLAAATGCQAVTIEALPAEPFDLLINASSVGMYPLVDQVPLSLASIAGVKLVFDLVYNPLETALLKEARSRGIATIRGVEMFAEQARAQFELYTGLSVESSAVQAAALKVMGEVD